MTDHPAIFELDEIRINEGLNPRANAALETAAAAIRALAQFRPHHPAVVVSSVYAVLHVPFDAVVDAREVLGDFDLGRFDMVAARADVQRGRDAYNATLTSDEIRAKWGR